MPTYILETTVLSAFAVVRRLDLLERRYRDRAVWTAEVCDEILRGIREIEALGDVIAADWLPPPIHSFAVERIEQVRLALGGRARPGDVAHLGEAATIVVALDHGYVVATDDFDATRLAQTRGLRTINTLSILRACARDGWVSAGDAKALRDEMVEVHGRDLPEVTESDFE